MTTQDLVLYGERFWYSPYVFNAFVALTEKKLPFVVRELALDRDEQRDADYAAQTLTGRVPALRHGDFWLAESSAIVEYLDDTFAAHPMLPRDPRDRARCRQLMAWQRSDLLALRTERPTSTMFYEHTSKPLTAAGQAAVDKLFDVCERVLPLDAAHLFGAFTIVDAELAFMLHRLLYNGDAVPERLERFARAHFERPSVRAFVEHARPEFVPYG